MKVLITGGLGFIGINAVLRFRELGHAVTIFDNLSKSHQFVEAVLGHGAVFKHGDIRSPEDVESVVARDYDLVIHLSAQTAVTTSVAAPVDDFKTNAWGTLNLLESVYKHCRKARILYSSTNKVYGNLECKGISEDEGRYHLAGGNEIDEDEQLDFYSPYGCSKGCADQYVRDYGRIYGLDTVVIRQSCIYGPYQLGTEDQGWLAWFTLAAMRREPITIFGTGKQVRDALYVSDLVDFYERLATAERHEPIYNIGGGAENTISLLELVEILERKLGNKIELKFENERPGDQKVFVSGNKLATELGWKPGVDVETGVSRLIGFFRQLYGGKRCLTKTM